MFEVPLGLVFRGLAGSKKVSLGFCSHFAGEIFVPSPWGKKR